MPSHASVNAATQTPSEWGKKSDHRKMTKAGFSAMLKRHVSKMEAEAQRENANGGLGLLLSLRSENAKRRKSKAEKSPEVVEMEELTADMQEKCNVEKDEKAAAGKAKKALDEELDESVDRIIEDIAVTDLQYRYYKAENARLYGEMMQSKENLSEPQKLVLDVLTELSDLWS